MSDKRLRYLDASVLITAIRKPTRETLARRMRAHQVLNDPRFEFVGSEFLKLETLPIPTFFSRDREIRLLNEYFGVVSHWAPTEMLVPPAIELASQFGLGAIDALHICAARYFGAEFVSVEKPTKPIYRAYANSVSIYEE